MSTTDDTTDLGFSLFDGITSTLVEFEEETRFQSALVNFITDNGEHLWSASVWTDDGTLEGFILCDHATGVEIVVRNPAAASSDPLLGWAVDAICSAGKLDPKR